MVTNRNPLWLEWLIDFPGSISPVNGAKNHQEMPENFGNMIEQLGRIRYQTHR